MATNSQNNLITLTQVVSLAKIDFNKLAKVHKAVNFQREMSFALQILAKSEYLQTIALGDKDAFKSAILNVAAIGLTLNPLESLCYLVPRKKQICLDISYLGYVFLAIDSGSILWTKADIVRESDKFELRGISQEPLHERDPFANERGKIVGTYCVAKLPSSDFLTTTMPIDKAYDIRGRSEAWKAYEKDRSKINPWVTDEEEMIKKTVIKNARKSWPRGNSDRLDRAIQISSESDPIDFENVRTVEEIPDHSKSRIQELLKSVNRSEKQFVGHLSRVFNRDIFKLDELTDSEISQSLVLLEGMAGRQKVKESHENVG